MDDKSNGKPRRKNRVPPPELPPCEPLTREGSLISPLEPLTTEPLIIPLSPGPELPPREPLTRERPLIPPLAHNLKKKPILHYRRMGQLTPTKLSDLFKRLPRLRFPISATTYRFKRMEARQSISGTSPPSNGRVYRRSKWMNMLAELGMANAPKSLGLHSAYIRRRLRST